MKNLLILITIMVAVGCGKDKETPQPIGLPPSNGVSQDKMPWELPNERKPNEVWEETLVPSRFEEDINATVPKEKKED